MKKLPIVIFIFIMLCAVSVGICSYHKTERKIKETVDNALSVTLRVMSPDRVDADTIRCYRNHISITEVRDTACIAVRTSCQDGKERTELVAEAGCGFTTVLMMSDQRASVSLSVLALLWLFGSVLYVRKHRLEVSALNIGFGGIFYDTKHASFMTTGGEQIRLTPMQQDLMEMFWNADDHTLTKKEICDRLWPKKPDASDTLYTLIRRIKPILEANSNLRIESDRGRNYSLKPR